MPKPATKKTTRKRTVKTVAPEVQAVAVPEVAEAQGTLVAKPEVACGVELEPEFDSIINRVYLVTRNGFEVHEGPQARPIIKEISEIAGDDDSSFRFYEHGAPVYLAIKASEPRAMTFPDPGPAVDEYGLTSVELYGLAVTLANTISRIVELETCGKPSLMMEAKKIMTLALPIVAAVFVIFLMVVIMTD